MKIKTTLIATVLLLTPALAYAQCAGAHKASETAMSCAEGMVIDPETNTCVPQVTG